MSKSTDWSNLRPDGTPYRDGLDDGPPLPTTPELEAAYRKIRNDTRTDVERINYLESRKYAQVGIGYDGYKFVTELRINQQERYQGRNLRDVIDAAMDERDRKL